MSDKLPLFKVDDSKLFLHFFSFLSLIIVYQEKRSNTVLSLVSPLINCYDWLLMLRCKYIVIKKLGTTVEYPANVFNDIIIGIICAFVIL